MFAAAVKCFFCINIIVDIIIYFHIINTFLYILEVYYY